MSQPQFDDSYTDTIQILYRYYRQVCFWFDLDGGIEKVYAENIFSVFVR
ncbi:MAG: hypothetical protein U9P44_03500 [archaeon]|nr:hypothetical protein [archaeon]